jgi:tetratricopeptide (TPR) repeat protein
MSNAFYSLPFVGRAGVGVGLAIALTAAAPIPVAPMLDALKAAPNQAIAGELEARIIDAWHNQATAAVQLLEDHAVAEIHEGKFRDALADADAALILQPDIADLWRRRAEIRFILNDDEGAYSDLAQALTREKREFPALAALSRFAEARKDNAKAIDAWKKFLEIDPQAPKGQERLKTLQTKLQGQAL